MLRAREESTRPTGSCSTLPGRAWQHVTRSSCARMNAQAERAATELATPARTWWPPPALVASHAQGPATTPPQSPRSPRRCARAGRTHGGVQRGGAAVRHRGAGGAQGLDHPRPYLKPLTQRWWTLEDAGVRGGRRAVLEVPDRPRGGPPGPGRLRTQYKKLSAGRGGRAGSFRLRTDAVPPSIQPVETSGPAGALAATATTYRILQSQAYPPPFPTAAAPFRSPGEFSRASRGSRIRRVGLSAH